MIHLQIVSWQHSNACSSCMSCSDCSQFALIIHTNNQGGGAALPRVALVGRPRRWSRGCCTGPPPRKISRIAAVWMNLTRTWRAMTQRAPAVDEVPLIILRTIFWRKPLAPPGWTWSWGGTLWRTPQRGTPLPPLLWTASEQRSVWSIAGLCRGGPSQAPTPT